MIRALWVFLDNEVALLMQVVHKLETYMHCTYMYNVQNVHIDVTHP
jgi:hypothetical protein